MGKINCVQYKNDGTMTVVNAAKMTIPQDFKKVLFEDDETNMTLIFNGNTSWGDWSAFKTDYRIQTGRKFKAFGTLSRLYMIHKDGKIIIGVSADPVPGATIQTETTAYVEDALRYLAKHYLTGKLQDSICFSNHFNRGDCNCLNCSNEAP